MRNRKKIIIFIVSAILLLCLFIGLYQCTVYYILPPDQEMAEQLYGYDEDDFGLIIDYFVESEDIEIFIDRDSYRNGEMQVAGHKIEDKQVLQALKRLFSFKGYRAIGRNGNTIYFEKWSFGARSIGLAYLLEDGADLWIQALVDQEPLSQNNWYYYETDYYVISK